MRFRAVVSSTLQLLTVVFGSTFTNEPKDCLPVIDLGYGLHQALSYNETSKVYLFQNIRYAQPPTGSLRFRAPAVPEIDRSVVQNGSGLRNCPQGMPAWQAKAYGPVRKFSNPSVPFNLTAWEDAIATATIPNLKLNAETTEDCLFLDVHVPKRILDGSKQDFRSSGQPSGGAPVLVWIHGGGYTLGSKTGAPSPVYFPDGLLAQADASSEGMIYVALNYRLGALGFLAGPELAADGDLNAGLLDQRLAFDWVQKHIHLFGGSSQRVTVMGESAGGGSAILQMAAFGGESGPAPFAQIIAQSPAAMPKAQPAPNAFSDFLTALNVSTLDEAMHASSADVIKANEAQIAAAPDTNYNFGPARIFHDPAVRTEEDFKHWLEKSISGLEQTQRDYLTESIYPPTFDGSLGYVDQATRQMALWEEAVIICHFWSLCHLDGKGYAYEFDVSPGFHTQDLKYTFNDPASPAPYPQAQNFLQRSIATFVQNGMPALSDDQEQAYPIWGHNQSVVKITEKDMGIMRSDINETRCNWWRDV